MVCWAGVLPAPCGAVFFTSMSETIIYQAYPSSFYREAASSAYLAPFEARTFFLSNFLTKVAKILAAVGIIFLAISYAPSVWYWANGREVSTNELLLETAVSQPSTVNQNNPLRGQPSIDIYQPRVDTTLPTTGTLKIASIGVITELQEAPYENFEEALKKGVWRASDSGTPFNRTEPTILAAHRFGYLAWSNTFRRENSFYNLPKLSVGETVEITYRQRKYVYEVYGESRGEDITDYSADLILYTCEQLNSSVRIFKYARLLEV